MATDKNCFALIAHTPQEVTHLDDAKRIKAIRWLIEDQKFGFRKQHHRQTKSLLHPQGILPDRILRSPVKSNDLKHLINSGARITTKSGDHLQIFASTQTRIEGRGLDERPHTWEVCSQMGDLLPKNSGTPRGGAQET